MPRSTLEWGCDSENSYSGHMSAEYHTIYAKEREGPKFCAAPSPLRVLCFSSCALNSTVVLTATTITTPTLYTASASIPTLCPACNSRRSSNNSSSSSSMSEDGGQLGLLGIWAIGVGSALGGIFFGWQWVLYSGFIGALCSVAFVAGFYWLYAGVITELAARYKTGGGSFDFVCFALGQRQATIMAILNLMKLILANAATAMVISSYMGTGGYPASFKFLIWLLVYIVFTLLDCIGITNSVKAQFVATAACVSLLFFYNASAISIFNVSNLFSMGYADRSISGFLKGLPFALQFFDGFEEIPLLMNYAKQPDKTIPQGIVVCYVTVALLGVFVLVSTAGATSAKQLLSSEAPLMDVIGLVFGMGTPVANIFAYLICMGLLVNFFSFVVYSSQQLQFVAATGRLPLFLAYRHPSSGSPVTASVVCSSVGLVLVVVFTLSLGDSNAQNILLVASILPAVVGYILTLECICAIRTVERRVAEGGGSKDGLTIRELDILGTDLPSELRYGFGVVGARLGQLQCLIIVTGFAALIGDDYLYFYGIIVDLVVGCALYMLMLHLMPFNLHRDGGTGNSSILNDPVAQFEPKGEEYAAALGVPQYESIFDDTESSYLIATDNPVLSEEGMGGNVNPLRKKRLSLSQPSLFPHPQHAANAKEGPEAEHDPSYDLMYGRGEDSETVGLLSENPIIASANSGKNEMRRKSVASDTVEL